MRSFLTALFLLGIMLPASRLEAQRCQAPFAVASAGGPGGRMVVSGDPRQRLADAAAPKAPDYITRDSKALLAKVKLDKVQSDTVDKMREWYVGLQKKAAEQALTRYKNSGGTCTANADSVYLTEEMRNLRQHHSSALRAVLKAEQTPQFDLNATALAQKEPPGD
jgi:hypothetical protein